MSVPSMEYAAAAAEKLDDINLYVRWAALEVLAKMGENSRSHVGAISSLLEDSYLHVQLSAIETLGELREVAEDHAGDVAAFLESDSPVLQKAATATLEKMGDAGAKSSQKHILVGAENRLADGSFAVAAEGIHLLAKTNQLTPAHVVKVLSMSGTPSEWTTVFESLQQSEATLEVVRPFAQKLKRVKIVSNPDAKFENPARMYSLQTCLHDKCLGITTPSEEPPHLIRDKQVAAEREQRIKREQRKKDNKVYLADSRQPKAAVASQGMLDQEGNLNPKWQRPTLQIPDDAFIDK